MKVILLTALLSLGAVRGQTIFESQFRRLHKPPVVGEIDESGIVEAFVEQRVDHFDQERGDVWKQRYLSRQSQHKIGGPVFVVIGGEWEITPTLLGKGHVYDMAKEVNAHLFAIEHRFYGNSTPAKNLTLDALKYLTVPQVLKDLENFLRHIQIQNEELREAKIVLFGSGYAGSLAIWLKRANPDVVAGVWAASAPLLAKVDFEEYREDVGISIAQTGDLQCLRHIYSGLKNLRQMFDSKRSAEVKAMLQICDSFDEKNTLDLQWLFTALSNEFSILVESHRHNSTRDVCREMLSDADPTIAAAKWLLRQLQPTSTGTADKCNDFTYRSLLDAVGNTRFNNEITGDERKWTYQTCNEFGWFPTTTSAQQIFGGDSPLQFYVTICRDALGDSFTEERIIDGALLTNFRYHGPLHGATDVYLTYGTLDPWIHVGSPDHSVQIPNESHAGHFESIHEADSSELKVAKRGALDAIREWL